MKKTKEGAEQTKKNIIESALKIFVEKGYEKTTLSDIAAKAGVTRGAVYWHFKNKFDILKNLNNLKGKILYNKINEVMAQEKTALGKIRKMFDASFDLIMFDENFMMYRELIEFKLSNSDEIKEILKTEYVILKNFKELLIDIIKDGKEEGKIRDDIDTEFMAISFLNWAMGLQRIWMQFKDIYNVKEKKKLILKNIEKMIKV